MMETLPTECDPAWLPDPDAQWWFRDGHDWRALEDVDAMVARWQCAPYTKFARGGELRVRAGSSELFGCWVRPRGTSGTGRWVDQEEARRAWYRGEELWWGSGWERREGVPEEISPPLPSPPPERTERSPALPPNTFVVDKYPFTRVHIGGRAVWVGPPTEDVLQKWRATRKAAELCQSLCTSSGQHAYVLTVLGDEYEPFRPTGDWRNHIRIATREEIEAYWTWETTISNATSKTQRYPVWAADHNMLTQPISCYECSVTLGQKGCNLSPGTDGPRVHCRAHFAVEAALVAEFPNKLHTLTSEE